MAFSCMSVLSLSWEASLPPLTDAWLQNPENSAVSTLVVRSPRRAFCAIMSRDAGDLWLRWNRILAIFAPRTFSHNQGHERSLQPPRQSVR